MSEPIRMELEGAVPLHSWLVLEPEVTLPMGAAATHAIFSQPGGITESEMRGVLAPILVRFGIREWSFHEPITSESVARLLPFAEVGFEVADKCMGLYLEGIIRPLAARRARLLGIGATEGSISPNPESGPPPKSPSPSLRKSTAGSKSEGRDL